MITKISDDLILTPSEKAKICLNCDKKKCAPGNCERFRQEVKKLKKGTRNND